MEKSLDFNELIGSLQQLSSVGYIKTHRKGNTGIGKTLEDILGITENNVQGPDTGNIEIKSARRSSSSPLTLFTKEPPKSRRPIWKKDLVRMRGYIDDKGRDALKVKLKYGSINSCDLKVDENDMCLLVKDSSDTVYARYPKSLLERVASNKFPAVVYMIADVDHIEGSEAFWFNEGYYCCNPTEEDILELIRENTLNLELRMHIEDDGSLRNRGSAWRLNSSDDLKNMFNKVRPISDIDTDSDIDLTIPNSTRKQSQLDQFIR